MMKISLSGRSKINGAQETLAAFIQSLDMHSRDEVTICSSALDIVRAYMGERPCCIWRSVDSKIEKVCERGMVEVFYNKDEPGHLSSLARALASGAPEFDPCRVSSVVPELKNGFDGFIHIPIKSADVILGLFTLAVKKRESKNIDLIQPLECLGKLIGMTVSNAQSQDALRKREMQLKAEVQATTKELSETNSRLIERVKELKMLYKELQNRVKELTHANKAKNEFLSIVSHELRTPLTSLTGFLCVLIDGESGPVNGEQMKFLKIIKKSADRLNVLISDLLDISRIESGRLNIKLNETSLLEILEQSTQGLRSSAEKKDIQIKLEADPALPLIYADSGRIQQVVDNLISNAIKYSNPEQNGLIRVVAIQNGDFAQVSVIDNGMGLTQEEREKVFDMFYQVDESTRRSSGGAGLGLAIARGIVSVHGGELWVESVKGQGSNFSFMIPRSKIRKAA